MHLAQALALVASQGNPEKIERFRRDVEPEWVSEALAATGTATLRTRRLPADQVVWLVIGMGLYRDRPIMDVADKLDLILPGPATVESGAVSQARARLGDDPMEWLFKRTGDAWAHASADRLRWRGLSLYGVDGTTLRVPDTAENAREFGHTSSVRGESAYPTVRLVALMALRSHLLAQVAFGAYRTAEVAYARQLWAAVPDNSLSIVDRGFLGAPTLVPLRASGQDRHWLTRAKKNTRWKTIEVLGAGDELVEMDVSSAARRQDPTLPRRWQMRAIRYQIKGFQPQVLLTSLIDPRRYPSAEIVRLYHERWELELGYDEIKTEMLDREETLRSRTAIGVRQEIWGILIGYNLIRLEMERIADEAGVPPVRISFVMAMRLICDEWHWLAAASPGAIPKHLRNLRAKVARFVLPERRANRSNPRAVKIKMSNYAKKRPYPDYGAGSPDDAARSR